VEWQLVNRKELATKTVLLIDEIQLVVLPLKAFRATSKISSRKIIIAQPA
jgi:hypothetical protein